MPKRLAAREALTARDGGVLTEAQVAALERMQHEKEVRGEFESECPGYCGAQDTFYVGTLKGVGRIYQQTFIDTYCKVAFAKLYTEKTSITAADLLNDRVLPFFADHEIPLNRLLTDRGTEYCGAPDRHPYELYLAVEDIDHTRTRAKSPQTNGICERLHKTLLNEFYRVTFRKTLYRTLEQLQADLDAFMNAYNFQRPHQGRWCHGKNTHADVSGHVGVGEGAADRMSNQRASTPSQHARGRAQRAVLTVRSRPDLYTSDVKPQTSNLEPLTSNL